MILVTSVSLNASNGLLKIGLKGVQGIFHFPSISRFDATEMRNDASVFASRMTRPRHSRLPKKPY